MRWNNELDKKLTHLVLDGKDTNEIANELNITCKCVTNRIFRLGIKILKPHRVTIKCKFCGKSINKTISDEKQFCNRSCSGHYNSKGRKHSEKTKEKIRLKNTGKIYPSRKKTIKSCKIHTFKSDTTHNKKFCNIGNNKQKIIDYIEIKFRKCRSCGEIKPIEKYKIICKDCSIKYYSVYRPLCSFHFNLNDYKDEFDFDLIKKYGWYSPTNKKNNLEGISRDHIYSVNDGFVNKIDPKIISHPANCRLMIHSNNNIKNRNSEITIEDLLEKIKQWNIKYS